MEIHGYTKYEQDALASELSQCMELSKQLRAQMSMDIQAGETKGMLVERMHSCIERSLKFLTWGETIEQSHQHVVPINSMPPGSPLSTLGSPNKSEHFNTGFHVQNKNRDIPRKRKVMPTWKDQVKANATETAPEDGYSWRKYGQKEILGAKHPRSYYRCTYRNMQGCNATKQVQRNDEDPMQFDITYKGTHTCTQAPRSKSAPTSPEERVCNKQNSFLIMQYQQQPDMLLNFQTGLRVDVQNLENQETGFFFPTSESGYGYDAITPSALHNSHTYSSYPQSYIPSPATSESTYFSTSPCKTNAFGGFHYGQHSESELTDIISATTSRTTSPIIGTDFNQWEFDPSFLLGDKPAFSSSFSQDK